jgi:hypothetical protein
MEKITIEIAEYGFNVSQGDKSAEVGWDEMLGLVASLTMPEKRPCLQWMETEEQRTANRAQWFKPHDNGKWVCQKCGELIDGRKVTFEEYHEGCGGRCV